LVQDEIAKSLASILNSRQKEILVLLINDGMLSASEVHSKLSKVAGLRTVKGDLALLQTYHLIESHGQGRSTKWKLKSK